jgi:hypothetical protein
MSCPRCGAELAAPGLWRSDWVCPDHGSVLPLAPPVPTTAEAIAAAMATSGVPVWAPWPLPPGWLITGLQLAGDDRAPAGAAVLASSGPAPFGGAADLLLVAEEPGVGLGARLAGVPGLDPGDRIVAAPVSARVDVGGHEVALWELGGVTDRSAYVGEADGRWFWAISWPQTAGLLLHDHLALVDLRGNGFDLPVGAPSPHLRG